MINKRLYLVVSFFALILNSMIMALDNDSKEIQGECKKFDDAVKKIYAAKAEGRYKGSVFTRAPHYVLSTDPNYAASYLCQDFAKKCKSDPMLWIQEIEKYLAAKIHSSKDNDKVCFLWYPYIVTALRDNPAIGRWTMREFFKNYSTELPTRDSIDFLLFLSPFNNCFMARNVIREHDIITIFKLMLSDVNPSYDYLEQLPRDTGYFDLETGIDHPGKPGKIISGHLRGCDWGCLLVYDWFEPEGLGFIFHKFIESPESQRDQVVAQMQKFLDKREKALALTQALEDELRGQYAARMTVADFAAKLAEWQKRANDQTGDGTLQLLLDTLFYQVGRNAEAAMDARDTQMTAYLAGKVSEIFAKDGLKILAGKDGENLRNKDDFFRFLNPLSVQVYKKNLPLDVDRNVQLRILANIYEQKYHSGELFRLPGEKAETAPAGKAKPPAGGKPGK